MKSIIEQASSIMKAIEKAWNQAEQPKEFSIKVFEKEERNFFGMTTKPAKIGIFFGDKSAIHEKQAQKLRPEPKECRSFAPLSQTAEGNNLKNKPNTKAIAKVSSTEQKHVQSIPTKQPAQGHQHKEKKQTSISTPTQEKSQRIPATWNETMITSAHSWLKKTLELMNIKSVEFNSQVTGKNLKLIFNMPIVADMMQEKQLFRSFAHLIMSSLRNQYKQEIKDLRIILVRAE